MRQCIFTDRNRRATVLNPRAQPHSSVLPMRTFRQKSTAVFALAGSKAAQGIATHDDINIAWIELQTR
jgi:hypothetical protein